MGAGGSLLTGAEVTGAGDAIGAGFSAGFVAATIAGLGVALGTSTASALTATGADFSTGVGPTTTAGFGAAAVPLASFAVSTLVSGARPLEFSTATSSPSGVSSIR